MANEDKSFETLVSEAPSAPAAETVSLVGTLAKSPEKGKFALTLQNGSVVTLETAAVKRHTVLGTSVGQTIVRLDIEASKLRPDLVPRVMKNPWEEPARPPTKYPFQDAIFGTGYADPPGPNTVAEGIPDPFGFGGQVQAGAVAPFALATLPQAPPDARAALLAMRTATGGYLEAAWGGFTGLWDVHPYGTGGPWDLT